MNTLNDETIAQAAYDAMVSPPPYAVLATALTEAGTRTEREQLLAVAPAELRADALNYLAEPEATRERDRRIAWMRVDPRRIAALKVYFATHPADFIDNYGVTVDPRLAAKKVKGVARHPVLPFILFPRQRDLIGWMLARYHNGEPGIVVKSRDVGASWIAMALSASMGIFHENFSAGVASATEIKLDRSGDDATLFYKLRMFLTHLPIEFRAGWTIDKHSAYMRVTFPDTGSSITGEAGEQAGRGSRKSWYIVDEAAHFENGAAIDRSLAAATDCRIDVSSVNGHGTSFSDKALSGKVPRFDFHWRDDPRKDEAWYARQCEQSDPITIAQEIDIDFSAATDCQVIPSKWAQAAIGLAEKLGIEPTGQYRAAMDVAHHGADFNALGIRKGCELVHLAAWKSDDIANSVARVVGVLDEYAITSFEFDCIGVGAAVEGDVRVLNEKRAVRIRAAEFIGSSSPINPSRKFPGSNQKNEDLLANRKSQSYWHLRSLFSNAWKLSQGDAQVGIDDCISIRPDLPQLNQLLAELSQVTFSTNSASKIVIDKIGTGSRSPNLADVVAMAYSPRREALNITPEMIAQLAAPVGHSHYMCSQRELSRW